jgi:GTP-sensing pleiotropic transcriptional regulator CodY
MFDFKSMSPFKRQRAIAKLEKMAKDEPTMFVTTHLMAEAMGYDHSQFDNIYKQCLVKCQEKFTQQNPDASELMTGDAVALMAVMCGQVRLGTFTLQESMENSVENSTKILVNLKKLPERFIATGRMISNT